MPSALVDQVKSTIKKHNMLEKHDRVLLGLSGGADSVALLNILSELKKEYSLYVYVAHLDHKFRGKESRGDRIFCEGLAKEMNFEFYYDEIDVPKIAKDKGLSSEEAARSVRYDFFKNICKRHDIKKIAVAHTKDDQAETVLMRMIRGSGMSGLGGMNPVKKIDSFFIIRPLIEASRVQVEDFLGTNKLRYRHDSSNDSVVFTRNKIRKELIPYLEKNFNSNIKEVLSNMAENLRVENEFFERYSTRKRKGMSKRISASEIHIDIKKFRRQPDALKKRILRSALQETKGDLRRFTYQHWKELELLINERPTNSIVDLPGGIDVIKSKKEIIIKKELGKK
ncbi:MAG: tRNA lysidine(34) synthetase TilS [Candidatus Omnitrophota bacterium]